MNWVIDIKNASVRYGPNEVLKNISCQIEKGDFVGLVGPNGGGKTTLAKTILKLTPLYLGKIFLLGKDINDFNDYEKIGYLPQKQTGINPLFPSTVKEVIALGLLSGKKWPKRITNKDWKKVDDMLDRLEITDLKKRLIFDLSGGQQQKVLLARALVSSPDLLILDEPSTALDPNSREQFFINLNRLNKNQKTTIILITHDTGYIGKYANKLLYLDRKQEFFGKITDFCPHSDISSCFEKSDRHIIWHQHQ